MPVSPRLAFDLLLGLMLFLYLLATVANRAVTLVGVVLLSYLLPVEDFGRYALAFTNALLLQVLFGAWLSASVNRLVATAGKLEQELVSTSAVAIGAFALSAVVLAGGNALLPKPATEPIFFALVLGWALAIITYDLTLNVLNGLGAPRAYAGLSFSRNLLSLGAAAVAAALGWGAEGAIAGQIAGTLTPILMTPAARRGWAQVRVAAASLQLLRQKLTLGVGGTLSLSIYVFLNFAARNIVGGTFGKAAAGHWALATDIFYGPVAVIGSSYALAAMPELYRYRSQGDARELRIGSTRFLEMMLYFAVPYAAAGALLAHPISLAIFAPDSREEVAMLAPWAVAQSAAILILYTLAALVLVYERFKLLAVLVFALTIGNALAIAAAERWVAGGLEGAMIASTIEVAAFALLGSAVAARAGIYRPDPKIWLRIALATGLMVATIAALLPILSGPIAAFGVAAAGGAVYAALTPDILKAFLRRGVAEPAGATAPAVQG